MTTYKRKAYYHETDQMGIIHHANYLKWMEEARVDFMDQMGFSYFKMEELGVISPVLGINVEYKSSVRFDDNIVIYVKILEYNGVRMTIGYEIYNSDSTILYAKAESKHCFMKDNKIVSLKKALPEFHQRFEDMRCTDSSI